MNRHCFIMILVLLASAACAQQQYCYVFYEEGTDLNAEMPLVYEWNFGDGSKERGREVKHCYSKSGTYNVQLNIIDTLLNQTMENEASYRLVVKGKSHVAWNNEGVAKMNAKNYPDAITDFDEALRLKADYAKAFYNRGICKGKLKDYQGAYDDHNKAIGQDPDMAAPYYFRAMMSLFLGKKDDICSDFEKARELGYEKATKAIEENCQ